jgi:hypothetical protein
VAAAAHAALAHALSLPPSKPAAETAPRATGGGGGKADVHASHGGGSSGGAGGVGGGGREGVSVYAAGAYEAGEDAEEEEEEGLGDCLEGSADGYVDECGGGGGREEEEEGVESMQEACGRVHIEERGSSARRTGGWGEEQTSEGEREVAVGGGRVRKTGCVQLLQAPEGRHIAWQQRLHVEDHHHQQQQVPGTPTTCSGSRSRLAASLRARVAYVLKQALTAAAGGRGGYGRGGSGASVRRGGESGDAA